MNKPCSVVISGSPPEQGLVDIEIAPGTSSLDVLRAVGLDATWVLSREGSNQKFAHEEELFGAIEAGSKIRATPLAEVGAPRWLVAIIDALGLAPTNRVQVLEGRRRSVSPVVVRRPTPSVPLVADGRLSVKRDGRSLYEIRGWWRDGNRLVGGYRLGEEGAFAGEIDLSNGYQPAFFIINPPEAVLNGKHAACFRKRGKKGKYAIHFALGNRDIDAGIVAIEKLLADSI